MYQNFYSAYPYAYYPSYPSYSYPLYNQEIQTPEAVEEAIAAHETAEVQPVSYPVLEQTEEDVQEKTASKETDTFTTRFLNYLVERKGTLISVTTSTDVISGTLEDVFSDCVLIKAQDENYHIRPEGIIYFK